MCVAFERDDLLGKVGVRPNAVILGLRLEGELVEIDNDRMRWTEPLQGKVGDLPIEKAIHFIIFSVPPAIQSKLSLSLGGTSRERTKLPVDFTGTIGVSSGKSSTAARETGPELAVSPFPESYSACGKCCSLAAS